MKVWVLGSRGLLGGQLVRDLKREGIPYVSTNSSEVDIRSFKDLELFAFRECPTHIINCAAYTNVDRAEEENELAFSINAEGPELLGKIATQISSHIIHVSTDYVFCGQSPAPYTEDERPLPQTTYGKTKWEGERRLLDQHPDACILRTSWIYGNSGSNFLSMCLRYMQQKEVLDVVEDQKGRLSLCQDVSAALLQLFNQRGIFHFANEGEVSKFEIVQEMKREADFRGIELKCRELQPVLLEEFPSLAKRPMYSVLDTKKWEKTFGYRPRHWKETIKEYIAYAV